MAFTIVRVMEGFIYNEAIAAVTAARVVGVPAEIKALTVAGLGVAGSFALDWVLITRIRLGRII